MADSKISGLAAVASFLGAQEFVVNDAGTSKKITGSQLIAAAAQGTLAGGYTQVVATQGTFTAQTDITGLTVTVTIAAGRRIRISCQIGASSTVAADLAQVLVLEGATALQYAVWACTTAILTHTGHVAVVLTPSAGAHTYKIAMARNNGTGLITMQAAPTEPAFILVEDCGV